MDDRSGKSVVVIGAGIVGVSTAIWLQRAGHRVTLVDRGRAEDRASYGNGGILASCSIVPVTVPGLMAKAPRMLFDPGQPLFLRWQYLPRLVPWLRRYLSHCRPEETERIARALVGIVGDSLEDHKALSAGTGAEKYVRPSDYVFIYRNRAHYESDGFGWSIRKANGFRWDELEGDAWKAYDPVFASDLGFAARLGNHGMIDDPGRYLEALVDHVEVSGGTVIQGNVEDIIRLDGAVAGVRFGGETIDCDAVVIATGVWSKELTGKLGLRIPIESERGYHLELWEPDRVPRSPVMIASGKFVVTPMDGRLRLAGIVEFGGLDAPPSEQPFRLLKSNVLAAMPGLTWKKEKRWMGHRPAPADSIPVIGAVPGTKGAYVGFGHHHIGLTGGPRTGRLLAQIISGAKPNIDVEPYSPARFQ